MKNTMEEEEEH